MRLVTSRAAAGGFTLVELMLAVAIMLTLAAVALPAYSQALDAAQVTRAVGDVRTLSRDVLAHRLTFGAVPDTLAELDKGELRDPWGNLYQYLAFRLGDDIPNGARKDKWLKPLNSLHDLYSMGKDGESKASLSAHVSRDDIVMANDGAFIGLAVNF